MRTMTFAFPAIEQLIYGKPAAETLRAESERCGARRVFLIVSGTMNRTTDEVAKVRTALAERYAGVSDGIPPFTPRSAVVEAARAARAVDADLIVRSAAARSPRPASSCASASTTSRTSRVSNRRDAQGNRRLPDYAGPDVAQIAIPTTLSAGEFQAGGGATNERLNVKQSYAHPLMIPRVIIFDPAPTRHTPLWVWLSTGVRALDHATEGLCSPNANPISDGIYKQALAMLGDALRRVKRDPGDLDARLDCQLGIWLSMSGRQGGVEMGASHAIGHVLGGSCGVPHGYTSCVMLPAVLRFNRSANAARQRLVAEALGRPGDEAADVVADLIAELGMPRRLADVGIGPERFGLIAANAMHDRWLHSNPVKIHSAEQVLQILESAA